MITMMTMFPRWMVVEKTDELISTLLTSMKGAEGLLSLKVSTGPLMGPSGPPAYKKILETAWTSADAMMAWGAPPENQTLKDFLVNNGVTLLFYEVEIHS